MKNPKKPPEHKKQKANPEFERTGGFYMPDPTTKKVTWNPMLHPNDKSER